MLRRVGRGSAICVSSRCAIPIVGGLTQTYRHKGAYFDALDAAWNTPWVTFSPRASAIEGIGSVMSTIHESFGADWSIMLFALGFVIRAATLYFSFYGERAASRMQHAVPQLAPAFARFEEVYYNPRSSSLAIQVAATELKAERNKVYLEWNTSNRGTLMALVGSPFVLFGFTAALRLVTDPQRHVDSDLLPWLHSLQLADPVAILPIACCSLTLLNAELSLAARRLDQQQVWARNIAWGIRVGCLCLIPAISPWPSGVLIYWLGLSTAGLLQPLLLRVAAFRKWFGILDPPTHAASTAATPSGAQAAIALDTLQSRLALQMPTFAKVVNPESEDKMNSRIHDRIRVKAHEDAQQPAKPLGFARRDWNKP